jgi:hypothetical protein
MANGRLLAINPRSKHRDQSTFGTVSPQAGTIIATPNREFPRWPSGGLPVMLQPTSMSMSEVGPHSQATRPTDGPTAHVYTVLVFDELVHAPWAVVVEAGDDAKAIALTRSLQPLKRRELWCGDRLVAKIHCQSCGPSPKA